MTPTGLAAVVVVAQQGVARRKIATAAVVSVGAGSQERIGGQHRADGRGERRRGRRAASQDGEPDGGVMLLRLGGGRVVQPLPEHRFERRHSVTV